VDVRSRPARGGSSRAARSAHDLRDWIGHEGLHGNGARGHGRGGARRLRRSGAALLARASAVSSPGAADHAGRPRHADEWLAAAAEGTRQALAEAAQESVRRLHGRASRARNRRHQTQGQPRREGPLLELRVRAARLRTRAPRGTELRAARARANLRAATRGGHEHLDTRAGAAALRRRAQPARAEVPHWDLPALAGAGAFRSTVADLLRFLELQLRPPATRLGRAALATHEP
jgi:hypothetical protein